MTRVASLYLPLLPIERLRRSERSTASRETRPSSPSLRLDPCIDDDPGVCSVPHGGGWRPGARWARSDAFAVRPNQADIDALPAHQRPSMREMGRRSEAADHPFKAMPSDEGPLRGRTAKSKPPRFTGRPLVLITSEGQRDVITAVCPLAHHLGIITGMAAAHARALVGDLDVRDADSDADQALLNRLAIHAVKTWTPTASVSGDDGLWLDLTGTTHLFGGELRFCQRLLAFLKRAGFSARIAISGTFGASHALARFGDSEITLLPPGAEAQALSRLPLASLRLTPEALAAASRFGLERVGDLYSMPRGPLARRLGMATVRRLDQARGITGELIATVVPFEAPRCERNLLEPISTDKAIAHVIDDLVDDLVSVLESRGFGLRAAVLTCVRVDADEQRVGFGASRATRNAKHLKRMLSMRIERIDPGMGIERMTLAAPHVEELHPETLSVGFVGESKSADIAPLIDQLAIRAGEQALFRVSAAESDVPERAAVRVEALATPVTWPVWKRPVRLLGKPELLSGVMALLPDHPPRRFSWRGKAYTVVAGDGPERIHGEWWRSAREMWAVRDYFHVETEDGARFWVFRRGDGVDTPTGDLTWYMHGLFG